LHEVDAEHGTALEPLMAFSVTFEHARKVLEEEAGGKGMNRRGLEGERLSVRSFLLSGDFLP
jgi:hypothetical protein